jgi:hypothetical protein
MLIAMGPVPLVSALVDEVLSGMPMLGEISGDSASDTGTRIFHAARLIAALGAATLVTLLIDRRLRR